MAIEEYHYNDLRAPFPFGVSIGLSFHLKVKTSPVRLDSHLKLSRRCFSPTTHQRSGIPKLHLLHFCVTALVCSWPPVRMGSFITSLAWLRKAIREATWAYPGSPSVAYTTPHKTTHHDFRTSPTTLSNFTFGKLFEKLKWVANLDICKFKRSSLY